MEQNNNFNEQVIKESLDNCYYNFLMNLKSYVESISDNEIVIPNKEEFINKLKTDEEFAKKWGNDSYRN